MGDCLVSQTDPSSWTHGNHWQIPLFSLCRNVSCLRELYSSSSHAQPFLPQLDAPARRAGRIEDLTFAKYEAITEVSAQDSVQQLTAAIRRRQPIILRGSAWDMPARTRWRDDAYLADDSSSQPFWTALTRGESSGEDTTGPLHESFHADLRWPSAFAEALHNFTSEPPHVWASEGGKRAAMHFDAVDNLHVIVASEKDVVLFNPIHLTHLYVDFFHASASYEGASGDVVCPQEADFRFGCDGFSCFGYSPIDAEHVDLGRFPRVVDATSYGARVREGDVLYIPAFWTHRLVHHPLGGGGRNIALSFARRPQHGLSEEQIPFAPHLARQQISWTAAAETTCTEHAEGSSACRTRDEL